MRNYLAFTSAFLYNVILILGSVDRNSDIEVSIWSRTGWFNSDNAYCRKFIGWRIFSYLSSRLRTLSTWICLCWCLYLILCLWMVSIIITLWYNLFLFHTPSFILLQTGCWIWFSYCNHEKLRITRNTIIKIWICIKRTSASILRPMTVMSGSSIIQIKSYFLVCRAF